MMRLLRATVIMAVWGALFGSVLAQIVHFKADSVRYKMSPPKEIVCLGRAEVRSASNLIRADKIVISGKNLDMALATGQVEIHDLGTGTLLRSRRVEYYQENDYIRLLIEPVLISKDLVIRSGTLERYNGPRLSYLQGPSVIEKSNLVLSCLYGRYDESGKTVRLRGDVEMAYPAGRLRPPPDRVSCGELVLFTEDDRVILGRDVRGTVYFDE